MRACPGHHEARRHGRRGFQSGMWAVIAITASGRLPDADQSERVRVSTAAEQARSAT